MKLTKKFRVKPGSHPRLAKIDPEESLGFRKKDAPDRLDELDDSLRSSQYLLYAEGEKSLLICLQAPDAAGKDGTVTHVLGCMNPQGTRVQAFKAPTAEELAHDFLWRIEKQVPKKGEVVVFNRSHYEDVLIVRVHNLVPEDVWRARYETINNFERQLHESGTRILKFYLHISPEEQLLRFKQRLDDPERHWKISESDYSERPYWDAYCEAYEEMLHRTSTDHAPWFIIPANKKWFRNFAVASIVAETFASMDMHFPAPAVDIEQIRRKYHAAERAEKKRIGADRWEKIGESKNKKNAKPAGRANNSKPRKESRAKSAATANPESIAPPVACSPTSSTTSAETTSPLRSPTSDPA